MGWFEDTKHELKMIARGQALIARGQSMIKMAQERLTLIADAGGSERSSSSPSPIELPEAVKAECEAARERVRKVMRAPGYVPKYR